MPNRSVNRGQWNDPISQYYFAKDQEPSQLPGMPKTLEMGSDPLRAAMGAAAAAPLLRAYFPDPHRTKPQEILQAGLVDAGLGGAGAALGAAASRNIIDPAIQSWHPLARAGVHALGAGGGGALGLLWSRYMQDGSWGVGDMVSRANQYYKDQARQQLFEEEERKKTAAWTQVPELVQKYAAQVQKIAGEVEPLLEELEPEDQAWYSPEKDALWIYRKEGKAELPPEDEIWVKLANPNAPLSGVTVQDAMDRAHDVLVKPQYAFNGPNPLTSAILGGLTVGGLGYGAGHLARWALPKSMRKYINVDALPSMGLMGGALMGAAPGMVWGLHSPKGLTSRWPFEEVGENEPRVPEAAADGRGPEVPGVGAVPARKRAGAGHHGVLPEGHGSSSAVHQCVQGGIGEIVWNEFFHHFGPYRKVGDHATPTGASSVAAGRETSNGTLRVGKIAAAGSAVDAGANPGCSGVDPRFLEFSPAEDARKRANVHELYGPNINAAQLSRSIMADAFRPYPGQPDKTAPQNAAAAAGVLQAAVARAGSDHVSPWDVTSTVMAMVPKAAGGAFGGAIAGATLGRTLGFLGALTPEGEQKAREAGMWAGLINSVVPNVFG